MGFYARRTDTSNMSKEQIKKVRELEDGFNALGFQVHSISSGWENIVGMIEIHFNRYYLKTNVNGFSVEQVEKMLPYLKKHNGSLVIHPVENEDVISISFNERFN